MIFIDLDPPLLATRPTGDSDCPAMRQGYMCTRDAGHDGQHWGGGANDLVLAVWDSDSEVPQ
jgi:hypothetical protein